MFYGKKKKKELAPGTAVVQFYLTAYPQSRLQRTSQPLQQHEVFITVFNTWISSSFLILIATFPPKEISLFWWFRLISSGIYLGSSQYLSKKYSHLRPTIFLSPVLIYNFTYLLIVKNTHTNNAFVFMNYFIGFLCIFIIKCAWAITQLFAEAGFSYHH